MMYYDDSSTISGDACTVLQDVTKWRTTTTPRRLVATPVRYFKMLLDDVLRRLLDD